MKRKTLLILFLVVTSIFSCNNSQTNKRKGITAIDTTKYQTSNKSIQAITSIESEQYKDVKTPLKNSIESLKANPVEKNTTSLADFYKQFDKTPQIFLFETGKDTTFICKEGTLITIRAKSFLSEKSQKELSGNIQISIKEYYKLSDIILAKLSTTTGDNLLETGGMIYISATSNNENCILKKGQNIEIEFPSKIEKEGMKLYSGIWKNSNKIDWKLNNNSIDLNQIYSVVDQMPSFPGGEIKMMNYLAKTVEYPANAKEFGIQGIVYIGFTVDRKGNIKNARVLRGIDPECDNSALNAIKKMPKFTVGEQNGVAVNVNFTLPIKFILHGGNSSNNLDYKKKFEKKYTETSIQNANLQAISSYLFTTSELGWINCDRLWKNISSPKANYLVNLTNGDESLVNIVFHRYKSILNGYSTTNNYIFGNIPVNEKITIVAIKQIDNKVFFAIKETETSTQAENNLVFKPVTMEILKSEMKKLDSLNQQQSSE